MKIYKITENYRGHNQESHWLADSMVHAIEHAEKAYANYMIENYSQVKGKLSEAAAINYKENVLIGCHCLGKVSNPPL